MATRTTRWSPDTCSCVFEYTWDDAVPQLSRSHTLSRVPNKCPTHTAQTDSNCYTTVLEENSRKNVALQVCLDNGPSTLYDLSGTTKILKSTVGYITTWSGTAPNRLLTVSFSGVTLTTAQKSTIQTALNTRLGSGKVTIV